MPCRVYRAAPLYSEAVTVDGERPRDRHVADTGAAPLFGDLRIGHLRVRAGAPGCHGRRDAFAKQGDGTGRLKHPSSREGGTGCIRASLFVFAAVASVGIS